MQFRQVQSSTNQKEYRKIYSVKADMRSKDFVSVFLLQQLLVTASRSGKEKEMNRKDVKKLLLAVIAVVIVAKIARDIMKARKQKENIHADTFDDFYEEEMNWWDKDLRKERSSKNGNENTASQAVGSTLNQVGADKEGGTPCRRKQHKKRLPLQSRRPN